MGVVKFLDLSPEVRELREALRVSSSDLWGVVRRVERDVVAVRVWSGSFSVEVSEEVTDEVVRDVADELREALGELDDRDRDSVLRVVRSAAEKHGRNRRVRIVDLSDGETETLLLVHID